MFMFLLHTTIFLTIISYFSCSLLSHFVMFHLFTFPYCHYLIMSLFFVFFFLMRRRPPISTRTYTLFPYTTLFRSGGVALCELVVHPAGRDYVVGDVVHDREIAAGAEHDRQVGEVGAAVGEGGEHRHADVRVAETAVGDARPQDGMHLRHVRAPQHEGVGRLEIVVAAHRLVDAESADEGDRGRGHAMAGIGVEVVGTQAGAHELGCRIALPDGPLAGAEHADGGRPLGGQRPLAFLRHDVEGFVPAHLLELALLVIDAVALAQQRPGQAVLPVHDLGEEVALHAVEAAVHLGLHVTVRGHHLAVPDAHHDAAAGAAEAAGRLGPGDLQRADAAAQRLGCRRSIGRAHV